MAMRRALTLDLSWSTLSALTVEHLCNTIRSSKSLTEINLGCTAISCHHLKAVCDALEGKSAIRVLDLGGNSMGDEGVDIVASCLESNNSIEVLDLSYNGITDDGLLRLSSMLHANSSLNVLFMHNNNPSAVGVRSLQEALEQNHSLKMVSLPPVKGLDPNIKSKMKTSLKKNGKAVTMGHSLLLGEAELPSAKNRPRSSRISMPQVQSISMHSRVLSVDTRVRVLTSRSSVSAKHRGFGKKSKSRSRKKRKRKTNTEKLSPTEIDKLSDRLSESDNLSLEQSDVDSDCVSGSEATNGTDTLSLSAG